MTRRPFLQSVIAMLMPWKVPALALSTGSPKMLEFTLRLLPGADVKAATEVALNRLQLALERVALATDGEPATASSVDEALGELMENSVVMKGERTW